MTCVTKGDKNCWCLQSSSLHAVDKGHDKKNWRSTPNNPDSLRRSIFYKSVVSPRLMFCGFFRTVILSGMFKEKSIHSSMRMENWRASSRENSTMVVNCLKIRHSLPIKVDMSRDTSRSSSEWQFRWWRTSPEKNDFWLPVSIIHFTCITQPPRLNIIEAIGSKYCSPCDWELRHVLVLVIGIFVLGHITL